jgi:hypothetical protein
MHRRATNKEKETGSEKEIEKRKKKVTKMVSNQFACTKMVSNQFACSQS